MFSGIRVGKYRGINWGIWQQRLCCELCEGFIMIFVVWRGLSWGRGAGRLVNIRELGEGCVVACGDGLSEQALKFVYICDFCRESSACFFVAVGLGDVVQKENMLGRGGRIVLVMILNVVVGVEYFVVFQVYQGINIISQKFSLFQCYS